MAEIAFIMGKSASGKDKIYKALRGDEELNLKTITMYTTRPMRSGETDGLEYFFVDERKAEELENAGKIIEMRCYDTVYGEWKYFTVDDGQVDLKSGARYIVIGTLEAYSAFCRYYGNEHIMPIYIEVDDGIRLERALKRERKQETPRYEEMCRRFLADAKDFSEENIEKCRVTRRFINNTELQECIDEVKVAIRKELMI
jgi:guanylate kinase